jgi:hypothetical protein
LVVAEMAGRRISRVRVETIAANAQDPQPQHKI